MSRTIQLRGSTTLLPIAQQVAEDYMTKNPTEKIVISAGGTARAYKAILDATTDIAMVSGILPEDLAVKIQRNGINITNTIVAYDAIVAVVNPENRVRNISVKQLKNIFNGRIANWKEVGGIDAPIKIYIGFPTGGITDTWKKLILGEAETYTPASTAMTSEDRLQKIMNDKNAITYTTLRALVGWHVKILAVDDVIANNQSVLDGSYLLRAPLSLVVREKSTVDVKKFIDFFLQSNNSLSFNE